MSLLPPYCCVLVFYRLWTFDVPITINKWLAGRPVSCHSFSVSWHYALTISLPHLIFSRYYQTIDGRAGPDRTLSSMYVSLDDDFCMQCRRCSYDLIYYEFCNPESTAVHIWMSASESIVMTFAGMDAISSVSFHLQAYEYCEQKNCEVFMITDKDKWRSGNSPSRKFL